MATVVIDMSMSLDGFVAGPNDGPQHPLGERGGERIFAWYQGGGEPIGDDPRFRPAGADRPIVEAMFASSGAVVAGRRTYDIAGGWGGTFPINALPVFVVTHEPPLDPPVGESRMTFVSDGVERAISEAREAAGDGVVGVSGASIAQQALKLGLVDELRLHIAPILLGDGVRLFEQLGEQGIELELLDVIAGPGATHVRYAVRGPG